MKKLFHTYPNISRLILGAILTALALVLSGVIPIPIPHFGEFFPFVGTTLVVLVARFMLYTENKDLSTLGFDVKKRNLFFLPFGLILGIVAFLAGFYARTFVTGEQWNINRHIQYDAVFKQLYWILASASVQEFIVRGYCFKKLIDISKPAVAIIISGLVFISMHDFWNGNVLQVLTFSTTLFIGHLMFAEAIIKSGTIYFAIGIHWGNNFANSVLFTEGQHATSLLYTTNQPAGGITMAQLPLIFLTMNIGFLITTFLIWKWKPKTTSGYHAQNIKGIRF